MTTTAQTTGSVRKFADHLAGLLSQSTQHAPETRWTAVPELDLDLQPTGAWNITGPGPTGKGRVQVRRQWNSPERVTVTFALPEEARGMYVGDDADQAALKSLTAAIDGGVANLGRRLLKQLRGYLGLLDMAAARAARQAARAEKRDRAVAQLTNLYGARLVNVYGRSLEAGDRAELSLTLGTYPDEVHVRITIGANGDTFNLETRGGAPIGVLGAVVAALELDAKL